MSDLLKTTSDRKDEPILAPKKASISVQAFQRAFGNLLQKMRKRRGKSQGEFSTPGRTVRRIEKGDAQLTSALELLREMNPCHKEAVTWTRMAFEMMNVECVKCDPDCNACKNANACLTHELSKRGDTSELIMERSMVKNLFDLNPYGIAIFDEDGRYLKGNQAYIDLFKEAPPKFITLFDSPPLKKAGMQGLFMKLKEGTTIYFPPFWHNSKDVGEQYPDNPICIGAVAFPLKDQQEQIRYYVIMFEDITKRVLAEDRLREALKFKSDFMATVSHELRTPLSGIIGSASLILKDKSLNLPESRIANIKNILGNTDKLVLMINNILDVARIGAGGMSITPQYFSIAEAIKTSVEYFHGLIDEKSLKVECDVDHHMPILFNDKQMVGQIVTNLVGNAVKFTDSGSILIHAGTDKNDPEKFTISVKDTGIGIPKDMLDAIFEHFKKLDASTTTRHPGIGMGLSIVKGYANLLGGSINVESEQNVGSKFSVTLPIAARNNLS